VFGAGKRGQRRDGEVGRAQEDDAEGSTHSPCRGACAW
jgi:hypothetical protein